MYCRHPTLIHGNFEQATIAERAAAFKKQCELTETIKFKEIDLYVSTPMLLFLLFCFFWWFLESDLNLYLMVVLLNCCKLCL